MKNSPIASTHSESRKGQMQFIARAIVTNVSTAALFLLATALIVPPAPSMEGQEYSFWKVMPLQVVLTCLGVLLNRYRITNLVADMVIVSCILASVGFLSYGRAFGF